MTMSESPDKTGYVPVNGLQMYYEIHGTGQPVVLLHGAFSAIGTSFERLLPSLAESRQVVAFELQGHGRTADADRRFGIGEAEVAGRAGVTDEPAKAEPVPIVRPHEIAEVGADVEAGHALAAALDRVRHVDLGEGRADFGNVGGREHDDRLLRPAGRLPWLLHSTGWLLS